MYAIILTGGKQLKAEIGQTIYVEKLEGEKDSEVKFDKVLYVNDDKSCKVGKPFVDGAVVTGKIVKQGKQPKIRVLRYRAKSNLRVHHGHRQPYTAVTISKISA